MPMGLLPEPQLHPTSLETYIWHLLCAEPKQWQPRLAGKVKGLGGEAASPGRAQNPDWACQLCSHTHPERKEAIMCPLTPALRVGLL